MLVNDFVEFSDCLPHFGIKVIFNTIIRSKLLCFDLPGIFCAIIAHLLPIWLCKEYINCYYYLVHSLCTIEESKWL